LINDIKINQSYYIFIMNYSEVNIKAVEKELYEKYLVSIYTEIKYHVYITKESFKNCQIFIFIKCKYVDYVIGELKKILRLFNFQKMNI